MPTNTDHTPLNLKVEAALAAYIDNILTSASLTGIQVLTSHTDTEALESPRCVIACDAMSAVNPDLPGVMDCNVDVEYLTQHGTTTLANHKLHAGRLMSWLADIAAVKAALSATDGLHCYWYQLIAQRFEKEAEDGLMATRLSFLIRAQGRAI